MLVRPGGQKGKCETHRDTTQSASPNFFTVRQVAKIWLAWTLVCCLLYALSPFIVPLYWDLFRQLGL